MITRMIAVPVTKRILAISLVGLLGACASIVEGTDQSITVSSDPTEALCELTRDGKLVGVVNPTPGTVLVDKSKDDITVECSKEDYQNGVGVLSSSFEGMTVGKGASPVWR